MNGVQVVEPENEDGKSSTDTSNTARNKLKETFVVVGVPAYNEEVGIGSVILESHTYADEIIVVDDGSKDRTVEIARKAGARVIEHKTNKGKGAAIQTLFTEVQEFNSDVDIFVLIDGDGQHMSRSIPDIAEPVLNGKADIVIGSRYLGQEETETPVYRRFGQKVLDLMMTGSSKKHLTDTQSGFRVISSDAISRLNISTDGMGVESEMISRATEQGLSIQEVPVNVRYEGIDGQTHNPVRHGLTVLVFITQLIRDRHPLLFFSVPGFLLLGIGGLMAINTILVYQSMSVFRHWQMLLSGFLVVFGTLSLFCGILLSQIANMMSSLEQQENKVK
jgi:glycosyltransferase involved in cell wall biosynthesis